MQSAPTVRPRTWSGSAAQAASLTAEPAGISDG